MNDERVCAVCGAPAQVVHRSAPMMGTAFDRFDDALYTMGRINCAAGHWYDQLLEDETVIYEEGTCEA